MVVQDARGAQRRRHAQLRLRDPDTSRSGGDGDDAAAARLHRFLLLILDSTLP